MLELAKFDNPISICDLAKKHAVSTKTLQASIAELQETLPSSFSIIKSDNKYSLCCTPGDSIESYISNMAQSTATFQFINGIFRGKKLTLFEWANMLFQSETTMRRRFAHINKILKAYNCKLSATPYVQIVGNEVSIRHFYYCYYGEFRNLFVVTTDSMFINPELQKTYTQLVQQFTKKNNVTKMPFNYRQLFRWLAVSMERINQKHYSKLDAKFIKKIQRCPFFVEFKNLLQEVMKKNFCYYELPEPDIVWLYAIASHSFTYYIEDEGNIDESKFIPSEEFLVEHLHIREFVRKAIKQFHSVTEQKDARLSLLLTAFLINMKLLTELSPQLQQAMPAIMTFVENNHPALLQRWQDIFAAAQPEELFPDADKFSLAITCTLISHTVLQTKEQKTKRVLFAFSGEPGLSAYLTNLSKKYLPTDFLANYVFEEQLDDRLINKYAADLVVCNYNDQTQLNAAPTFILSFLPTEKEWLNLRDVLWKL